MATLKAHTAAQSSNGNDITTGAVDTTGANLIVIGIQLNTPGAVTISDSKGNSYTPLTTADGPSVDTRLYYYSGTNVGSGHTFTLTGTGTFPSMAVEAFDLMATSSVFDVENGNTGSVVTTLATGSVTPSLASNVAVTVLGTAVALSSPSINSGFTISDHIDTLGNGGPIAMAYKIGGLSGSENPVWTLGTTDNAAANIATFKIDSGPSSVFVTSRTAVPVPGPRRTQIIQM